MVQSDGTLLLDVGGTWAAPARDALSSFAHLERSPEYVHTPSDAAGILQLREALAGRQASLPACR